MGGLLGVEETTAAASSGEFKKQNESDFYSRRILSPIRPLLNIHQRR